MNNKIKVLLVDDHAIVRNGIKMLLELDERIEVCGEAGTIGEALSILSQECKPDVVLLDFKLPDGDGVIGCRRILDQYPAGKVIILTAYTDEDLVMETVKAGAVGFLLKNIESKELLDAIYNAHGGQKVLDSFATERVFAAIKGKREHRPPLPELTSQEYHVLELISQGKANKEIAADLEISEKTVRNYASALFKKINVGNRTEATTYFMRINKT